MIGAMLTSARGSPPAALNSPHPINSSSNVPRILWLEM